MFQSFTMQCVTCGAQLRVEREEAIGQILNCPKCKSMVQIKMPALAGGVIHESESELPTEEGLSADLTGNAGQPETAAHQTQTTVPTLPRSPAMKLPQWALLPVAATVGVLFAVGVWSAFQLPTDRNAVDNDPASQKAQTNEPSLTPTVNSPQSPPAPVAPPADLESADRDQTVPQEQNDRSAAARELQHTEPSTRDDAAHGAEEDNPDPDSPAEPQLPTDTPHRDGDVLQHHSDTAQKPLPPASDQLKTQMLREVLGITFEPTSLKRAAATLAQLLAVPIQIDLAALGRAGIAPDTPVEYQGDARQLRDVLAEMLTPLGLVATETGDRIFITLPDADDRSYSEMTYDVPLSSDAVESRNLIKSFVDPDTWKGQGGEGTITINGNALLVSQTPAVHGHLHRFFSDFRGGTQRPSPSVDTSVAEHALSQTINCTTDKPVPLSGYLRQLGSRTDVRFVLDELQLLRNGISPSHPISVSTPEPTLQTLLEELLAPLGLAFRPLSADTILITLPADSEPELRVYFLPVPPEAVRRGEALLTSIRQKIAPDSWQAAGGEGRLSLHPASRRLILLQRPEIQQRVTHYLKSLP